MTLLTAKNVVIRWTGEQWIVEYSGPSGVYRCQSGLYACKDETDEELIWRAGVELRREGLKIPENVKIIRD
jgi:hypothetical protein